MPFYFIEEYQRGFGLKMQVEKILHVEQTGYQHIVVFKTTTHGMVLIIDDCVMTTEQDEFYYHEILVHPPMQVAREPRRVLIIGGGDGGTAREVLKYRNVERVDMIEIDEKVVEISKRYFPGLSCSFDDPRLNLMIDDGVKYIRDCNEKYDCIIIDSTDPIGPAVALFSEPFFSNCCRILEDGGAFAAQTESPFFQVDSMASIYRNLNRAFPRLDAYFSPVPAYGGLWSFALGTKGKDPKITEGWNIDFDLKYYNGSVHQGVFHLPNNMKKVIGRD